MVKKIHISETVEFPYNEFFNIALCNQGGNIQLTSDREKVTCKKCIAILKKRGYEL